MKTFAQICGENREDVLELVRFGMERFEGIVWGATNKSDEKKYVKQFIRYRDLCKKLKGSK